MKTDRRTSWTKRGMFLKRRCTQMTRKRSGRQHRHRKKHQPQLPAPVHRNSNVHPFEASLQVGACRLRRGNLVRPRERRPYNGLHRRTLTPLCHYPQHHHPNRINHSSSPSLIASKPSCVRSTPPETSRRRSIERFARAPRAKPSLRTPPTTRP